MTIYERRKGLRLVAWSFLGVFNGLVWGGEPRGSLQVGSARHHFPANVDVRVVVDSSGELEEGTALFLLLLDKRGKRIWEKPIKARRGAFLESVDLSRIEAGQYVLKAVLRRNGKVISSAEQAITVHQIEPGVAKRFRVFIEEPTRRPRRGFPVTLGIPFAIGAQPSDGAVRVIRPDGVEIPSQCRTVMTWTPQRKSAKWMLLDFLCETNLRNRLTYTVEYGSGVKPSRIAKPLTVEERKEDVLIDAGVLRLRVSRRGGGIFEQVWVNGKPVFAEGSARLYLVDKGGSVFVPSAEGSNYKVEVELSGPVHSVVKVTGDYVTPAGEKLCSFISRIHTYRDAPFVKIVHTLLMPPIHFYDYSIAGEDNLEKEKLVTGLGVRSYGVEFRLKRTAKELRGGFGRSSRYEDLVFEVDLSEQGSREFLVQMSPDRYGVFRLSRKQVLSGCTDKNNPWSYQMDPRPVENLQLPGERRVVRSGEILDTTSEEYRKWLTGYHIWGPWSMDISDDRPEQARAWLNTVYREQRDFITGQYFAGYRAPGWFRLGGVGVFLPEFAERYPKELEIEADGTMRVHFWPLHYPKLMRWEGHARTHQVVIHFEDARRSLRTSRVAGMFATPVVPVVDSGYIGQTGAYWSRFHGVDRGRYPFSEHEIEKLTDELIGEVRRQSGFWDYGAIHHSINNDRSCYATFRYWAKNEFGWARGLWAVFARGGARGAYHTAKIVSESLMDVETVQELGITTRHTNYHLIGGAYPGGHMFLDHLVDAYRLGGSLRALDVIRRYLEVLRKYTVRKNPGGAGRDTICPTDDLSIAYSLTWEPLFMMRAMDGMDKWWKMVVEEKSIQQVGLYSVAPLLRYYALFGGEKAGEVLSAQRLEWVRYLVDGGKWRPGLSFLRAPVFAGVERIGPEEYPRGTTPLERGVSLFERVFRLSACQLADVPEVNVVLLHGTGVLYILEENDQELRITLPMTTSVRIWDPNGKMILEKLWRGKRPRRPVSEKVYKLPKDSVKGIYRVEVRSDYPYFIPFTKRMVSTGKVVLDLESAVRFYGNARLYFLVPEGSREVWIEFPGPTRLQYGTLDMALYTAKGQIVDSTRGSSKLAAEVEPYEGSGVWCFERVCSGAWIKPIFKGKLAPLVAPSREAYFAVPGKVRSRIKKGE